MIHIRFAHRLWLCYISSETLFTHTFLMSDYLVCVGPKVLLPGSDNPLPASIVIDKRSGKILEVRCGQHTRQDLGLTGHSVEWIDAGNNIVLPGLVESVLLHGF